MDIQTKIKNTNYDVIFHLSHIDLDGYGCQIISERHFGKEKMKFYNANYGLENIMTIKKINKEMDKEEYKNHRKLFLITDLNLSDNLCKYIELNFLDNLTDVFLIDHHITGKDMPESYPWYYLNEQYCATKLTQQFFDVKELELFANYVNVQDLWKTKDNYFTKANYIADIAYKGYDFPWLISHLGNQYKFFTIKEVFKRVEKGKSVREIQNHFIKIQESFLKGKIDPDILHNLNIPIEHKYVRFIFEEIKDLPLPIIDFNGAKGKLFYDIGSNVFQQLSHMYNTEKKDVDFIFHIDNHGRLSFRSVGKGNHNNVANIASKYFNGGGHFNASGGVISYNMNSEEEAIDVLNEIITLNKPTFLEEIKIYELEKGDKYYNLINHYEEVKNQLKILNYYLYRKLTFVLVEEKDYYELLPVYCKMDGSFVFDQRNNTKDRRKNSIKVFKDEVPEDILDNVLSLLSIKMEKR